MHPYKNRLVAQNEQCLILQPCLVKKVGRSAALFIQQLHYWHTSSKKVGRTLEGRHWIYNTLENWADALGVSVKTVERAVKTLKEHGLIDIEKHDKKRGIRTNFYSINYKALHVLLDNKPDSSRHNEEIIIKNTKTTTETPISEKAPVEKKLQNTRPLAKFASAREFEGGSERRTGVYIEVHEDSSTEPTHKLPAEAGFSKRSTQQVQQVSHSLAQKLLDIWNKEVGLYTTLASMTKERARFLIAAFKTKFSQNLEEWEVYCKKIASSDFLMGKIKSSFKATLDWVLKFSTIQRILEGDFGVKDIYIQNKEVPSTFKKGEGAYVQRLREKLLQILGPAMYKSWIDPTYIEVEGTSINVIVKGNFYKTYIENHVLSTLPLTLRKNICIVAENRDNSKLAA